MPTEPTPTPEATCPTCNGYRIVFAPSPNEKADYVVGLCPVCTSDTSTVPTPEAAGDRLSEDELRVLAGESYKPVMGGWLMRLVKEVREQRAEVARLAAERNRLLAALTDAAAMFRKRAMEQRLRNHLAGVDAYMATAVIVETLRDDCAARAGPPPVATDGTP